MGPALRLHISLPRAEREGIPCYDFFPFFLPKSPVSSRCPGLAPPRVRLAVRKCHPCGSFHLHSAESCARFTCTLPRRTLPCITSAKLTRAGNVGCWRRPHQVSASHQNAQCCSPRLPKRFARMLKILLEVFFFVFLLRFRLAETCAVWRTGLAVKVLTRCSEKFGVLYCLAA